LPLFSRVLLITSMVMGLVVVVTTPMPADRATANTSVSTATASSAAWKARPPRMLRLRSGSTPRAVTLRALKSGRASVWRRNRTTIAGNVGARFVARASVRGHRTGQRVTLVVAEFASGRELQRRRTTVRVRAGEKVVARVPIRRLRAGSRFALGLAVPRLHRGQRIFLTGVGLRRRQARTPLSNGCAATARGLPTCGTYLGAAHGSNTSPVDLESATGGRLGIRRTYWTASQVRSAVTLARSDLARGRLPWISFKLPHSWADMAAGRGDAWARNIATRLSALPGPVWIAFHHEPEGDGDITTWRRIQERLAPIVRRTASNVAYTVILTGWNELYGDAQFRLDNIWPRNVKIDVAGFDVYNQYGVVDDGVTNTKGTNLNTAYFQPISAWAASHDVAWGLAETGYTNAASLVDPDWVKRTYGEMTAQGGIAFTYFDTTLNSVANWALSTVTKKQAYARARVGAPVLPPLR
jgi:hypothetical protein